MDTFDKHIGKTLNEHVSAVPDSLWDSIDKAINDQDDVIAIPFWQRWSVGVISLIILLIGAVGWYSYDSYEYQSTNDSAAQVSQDDLNTRKSEKLYGIKDDKSARIESLAALSPESDAVNGEKKNIRYNQKSKSRSAAPSNTAIPKTEMEIKAELPFSYVANSNLDRSNESSLSTDFAGEAQIGVSISKGSQTRSVLDYALLGSIGLTPVENQLIWDGKAPKITEICPDWSERRRPFSISAYAGPSVMLSSLESKHTENLAYTDARAASESIWFSWHAGLRVDYDILDQLFVRAGMEYEQLNRRMSYQDPDEQRIQTIITIDTIITVIDTLVVVDTSSVAVQGTRRINNINSFRQINIPVALGYRYQLSDRLQLSLAGGALLNIQSRQGGKLLNPDLDVTEFGSGEMFQPYESSFGLAFTGDIGLIFALSDQWSWFAETGLAYYPRSLTTEDYLLNEQMSVTRLRVGITHRFGKN